MYRIAKVFKIKPEMKAGYKKDHDEIWPELAEEIKNSGIKSYSIFFRKDGTLFSYIEVENLNDYLEKAEKSVQSEVSVKWEKCMNKYFIEVNDVTKGPVTEDLEEVFHLEF